MAFVFGISFLLYLCHIWGGKTLKDCNLRSLVWWRFSDDVFFSWLYGNKRSLTFFEYVDSYHQTTKYTLDWSTHEVSYLDVRVKLEVGKTNTDVYSKITDTHQYLDFKSCHPKHVKRGIPYRKALRLRRTRNLEEVYDNRLDDLQGYHLKRRFRKRNVDSQFVWARRKSILGQGKGKKRKDLDRSL